MEFDDPRQPGGEVAGELVMVDRLRAGDEELVMAAAKIAPSSSPTSPVGSSSRMKRAKMRSARSNGTAGGLSW